MKDTKEIVLFFKDGSSYNALDIAKELSNRFNYIGNPIILPENKNPKLPLVLFNTSQDLQISISRSTVNIIMGENSFKEMASIIFDVVDAFDGFKCKFNRIGYIANVMLTPNDVNIVKDKLLNMKYFDEEMEDFNICWYRKLPTRYGEINVWERLLTDHKSFSELLCQYDFNSPAEEDINIDMKYIKELIRVTDEFIDRRVNFNG